MTGEWKNCVISLINCVNCEKSLWGSNERKAKLVACMG